MSAQPLASACRRLVGAACLLWASCASFAQTPAPVSPTPSLRPAECDAPAPVAATAPDGRDRGTLWRIERDGRTSYLYGTVHVGRPAWAKPGPKIRESLAASDLLALELDVSDPAVVGAFVRALPQIAEPPIALRQRLLDTAVRECGDAKVLGALPPLLRVLSVALLGASRDGLVAAYGVDQSLLAAARELQRPVLSLEEAETQAQALAPERPGDFEQQLASMLDQMESGQARAVLRRLFQAWERGDVGELETYPRWCDCMNTDSERAWNARLNDQRNVVLANRIVALHSAGQRVFAAVGVLHFTGPKALHSLLEQQGFVVQPVPLQ